jgi:iron complex outermembrane receptor protein
MRGNNLRAVVTSGAVACLVILAAPAHAQAPDVTSLSLEQLGGVEITSVSRRPEPLATAPASIYVITNEDIRRSAAPNLVESLRLAPNLEVARMNGFGYTVTARGFNSPESSNKLLVLIDGRSVYSPLASSVFWENTDVTLADIDRIEVVSGPGGTLYGANAVNGVINVVSKNAHETLGGHLALRTGTTDTKLTARYGFLPWDGAAMRIYGMVSRVNDTAPVLAIDTSRTGWARNQGGFRFDQDLAGGDTLTLQGDLYANSTPAQEIEKGRGFNLTARWNHNFESGDRLEVLAYKDQNTRVLPTALAREELDTWAVQIQHNTALWWNDTFIWGLENRYSKEAFYSGGPFGFANPISRINVTNLFFQDQFRLLDDVKVTAGMKVENSSFSNVDFLPELRLAWQMAPDHTLWAAVSRAVRTPSKIDRELQSPGILNPAPNFHSEKLTAYELGYRATPLPELQVSASLYYNFYDDIRTTAPTPVTILPVRLRNGITGHTYGGEVWAKYALFDWWRLNLGASWYQTMLALEPGRADLSNGQSLGQDPPYQAQLRSEMNPFENWEFDAALRTVGHVKMRNPATGAGRIIAGAYTEMDLRIGFHLTPDTELSVSGHNLLNARHLEANDPSTYLPQYVPQSLLLTLRQRI